MTIVTDILKQMLAVSQPQRKFLAVLFATIPALRGRVTGRNLSRYCEYSERTIARQFRASFDWPDFHQRVMTQALDPCSELVSAQDPAPDRLSHRDSWLRGLDADAGINDLAALARRQSKDGVEVEFSDFGNFFNQERDA